MAPKKRFPVALGLFRLTVKSLFGTFRPSISVSESLKEIEMDLEDLRGKIDDENEADREGRLGFWLKMVLKWQNSRKGMKRVS